MYSVVASNSKGNITFTISFALASSGHHLQYTRHNYYGVITIFNENTVWYPQFQKLELTRYNKPSYLIVEWIPDPDEKVSKTVLFFTSSYKFTSKINGNLKPKQLTIANVRRWLEKTCNPLYEEWSIFIS